MREQNQEFEQEINLRECLEAIIKRKKMILAIFFISIIAAVALSFMTPRNYEIFTLIEPPVSGVNDSGSSIFVDSPLNIKAKVDVGAFDSMVVETLKLDPRKTKIKLKTSLPKDSTILKIALNEPEDKAELGIKILNQFINEMSHYYKNIIESGKGAVDRQVSVISNRIKDMNNSIKLNDERLKIIVAQEKELMDIFDDTKMNTEQLFLKRNVLLERKISSEDISSLLYTNTLQQNNTYISELNEQLANIKMKKEEVTNAVKTLQNGIKNSDIEIEKLKAAKENIRNIRVLREPQVSFEPIGAGRKQTVVLAGLLSLMVGIFLAFFMEFWQKTALKPKS